MQMRREQSILRRDVENLFMRFFACTKNNYNVKN